MSPLRHHRISFKNAAKGIIWAFTTQPNFRVHIFLATVAIVYGFVLGVSYVEMMILVLAIVFGLGIEMVNTSIESMTDLITKEYRQEARVAKDVAAGMMLLTAIGTVLVAGLIFLPRLLEFFLFFIF